eukprot:COSAG06_NODE_5591_length_3378_cov_1.351327_2_plen_63_part_00
METVRAPSPLFLSLPLLALTPSSCPCCLLIDAHEPDDGDDGTDHGRLPRLNPVRKTALSKSK